MTKKWGQFYVDGITYYRVNHGLMYQTKIGGNKSSQCSYTFRRLCITVHIMVTKRASSFMLPNKYQTKYYILHQAYYTDMQLGLEAQWSEIISKVVN